MIGVGESSRVMCKYLGVTMVGVVSLPFLGSGAFRMKQRFGKEGLVAIPKYHTLSYEEIDECCEGEGDPAKYIDR